MSFPYGVPKAVMFAAEIMLPLLSIDAITVEPNLKTSLLPDCSIVKLAVVRLVTEPPSVMLPAEVTVPDKLKPLAEPAPETEVTEPPPPAGADTQAVPVDVSTLPAVPGAEMPVPPFAAGSTPVTLVVRLAKVVDVVPVPPLAIGSVPDTSVVKTTGLLATLTKSVPFHATSARAPAGTVTPVVGPEPRMTIDPVPALIMRYALL